MSNELVGERDELEKFSDALLELAPHMAEEDAQFLKQDWVHELALNAAQFYWSQGIGVPNAVQAVLDLVSANSATEGS